MKLGILVTIISGFGKKGFYHSQEVGLGRNLSAKGHEVIIYKCVAAGGERNEEKLEDNLTIRYLPVRALGVHGYLRSEEIAPDLDGLLSFSDTQIFLPHIYAYCKKHGIAFVPYVGISYSFQQNLKSRVMDFLYAMTTRKIYTECTVLCKTNHAKEALLAQGALACRVTPVGLDAEKLKTDFRSCDRLKIRQEIGYGAEERLILFVARLKPEKRPLDLIEIFHRLPAEGNYRLIVIGTGEQRKEMDDLIEKYALADRVKIIDSVNNTEIWKYYYASDYFVNLRAEEIFGMAVMEAVFYEASVAAIQAPGPSTILEGMKGHRICADDAEVERWLSGEKAAVSDLRESSDLLLTKFTWDSCADAFVELAQKAK